MASGEYTAARSTAAIPLVPQLQGNAWNDTIVSVAFHETQANANLLGF